MTTSPDVLNQLRAARAAESFDVWSILLWVNLALALSVSVFHGWQYGMATRDAYRARQKAVQLEREMEIRSKASNLSVKGKVRSADERMLDDALEAGTIIGVGAGVRLIDSARHERGVEFLLSAIWIALSVGLLNWRPSPDPH